MTEAQKKVQEELVNSLITEFNKMDDNGQERLLRVFMQRSLAFQTLLQGYKQKEQDPELVLLKMGGYALSAVELYTTIVNPDDEAMLNGGK